MASKSRAPTLRRREPMLREFTISASMLKWGVGFLASLLLMYGGWKVVWDDIKTYWRQESIQAAKDKETDGKLKALAKNAETGRAWVFWSINDLKAQQQRQWAAACPALSQTADTCAQWKADAERYQREADDTKRDAQKSGKDGE